MLDRRLVAWMTTVVFALVLGACEESEQGRILRYEKGTYLGKSDTSLSDKQLEELRQRATLQGAG